MKEKHNIFISISSFDGGFKYILRTCAKAIFGISHLPSPQKHSGAQNQPTKNPQKVLKISLRLAK